MRLCWLLHDQETAPNNGKQNYSRLKTAVKLHVDQKMRTRKFRVRKDVVEKGSVTKSEKGKKAYVERKVGECFQWKGHGQCSKRDSWSFSHDTMASGNSVAGQRRNGEKDDRLLPHPIRRQGRLAVKKATKRKVLTREVRFCVDFLEKYNPSCKFWHLPVCQNYKSEKGCICGDKCHFRHVEAEEKPKQKSKKGGAKGSVAILKESTQFVCVSQDSYTWH